MALLARHDVTALADVRRHPGSRRHPQFASDMLAASLPEQGIEYAHFAALEAPAAERPAAVMCAEGMWWRCHRRLVADALLVRGWEVAHIAPGGALSEHALPDFAVVDGERLTYPAPQLRLG